MKSVMMAFVLTLLAPLAFADAGISVDHAWLRMVPPVSSNSAAYLSVHNNTDQAVELVAAKSDIANAVEMHTVIKEGNTMRMQALPLLEVPAHGSVQFKPGGNHIMFIGLKKPLEEGLKVPLTLVFDDGKTLVVTLTVKREDDAKGNLK